MTLVYQDKSYPDPGQLHEGNVHLIEVELPLIHKGLQRLGVM